MFLKVKAIDVVLVLVVSKVDKVIAVVELFF